MQQGFGKARRRRFLFGEAVTAWERRDKRGGRGGCQRNYLPRLLSLVIISLLSPSSFSLISSLRLILSVPAPDLS